MASLRSNVDFLKLFSARLVTNAGDSLYTTAAFWLVHELTGSSFYTGVAGFLLLGPPALQFLTGPFVDRWSLRRLLVGTQVFQMIVVLVVPLAAWLDVLSVEIVLVVIPILAMTNQFVYPAQRTVLPRVVSEEALVRANSAFSFAYRGTNLAFNAVGGVLIALVGAVLLYLINSATFVVAAALFAALRVPPAKSDESGSPDPTTSTLRSRVGAYLAELGEGLSYLRGTLLVRLMFAPAVINLVVGAMMALLPAFAAARGGPGAYGALLAAMGAGMLLGSVLASALEGAHVGYTVIVGFGLSFLAWLGVVYSPWLPATVGLYCLVWVPAGVYNVIEETIIQTSVTQGKLGRVNAVATSLSMFTLPIGSLVAGSVVELIGLSAVMLVVGTAFVLVAGLFFLRPGLRRLPAVGEIDTERLGLAES